MKTVYLFRHAKSSWKEAGLTDKERPLNKRGWAAALAMGRHLAARYDGHLHVLCSTAVRARQTLDRFLEGFGGDCAIHFESGLYMAGAHDIIGQIQKVNAGADRLMVIGHNPGMHAAARALAATGEPEDLHRLSARFPTAALAEIAFEADDWRNIGVGQGILMSYIKPREIA